jgi:predicted transcriptional regulator
MTARLDLRLPADLKHRLSLEAARDNRTVSDVTKLAIREYLDKRENDEINKTDPVMAKIMRNYVNRKK